MALAGMRWGCLCFGVAKECHGHPRATSSSPSDSVSRLWRPRLMESLRADLWVSGHYASGKCSLPGKGAAPRFWRAAKLHLLCGLPDFALCGYSLDGQADA
jgi:hypothetical protein